MTVAFPGSVLSIASRITQMQQRTGAHCWYWAAYSRKHPGARWYSGSCPPSRGPCISTHDVSESFSPQPYFTCIRKATYLLLGNSQRPPFLPNQPRPLRDSNILEVAAFLTVLRKQDVRSHGLFGLALVVNLRESGSPLVLPVRWLRWELLVQLTAGSIRLLDLLW